MLRDTREDTAAGYVNIPREFLETHAISAGDLDSPAYRTWVQGRVQLARDYFKAGEGYLAQVENLRCRLAGYAYIARFTVVLDAIQSNGYRLQAGAPGAQAPGGRVAHGLGRALDGAQQLPPRVGARAADGPSTSVILNGVKDLMDCQPDASGAKEQRSRSA